MQSAQFLLNAKTETNNGMPGSIKTLGCSSVHHHTSSRALWYMAGHACWPLPACFPVNDLLRCWLLFFRSFVSLRVCLYPCHMIVCMFTSMRAFLYINFKYGCYWFLPACMLVCPPAFLSFCLFVLLSVSLLSFCRFFCLSVCLYVLKSACPSAFCPSVCLSFCLSVCPSVYPFVCLPFCLTVLLSFSCLSVCL